MSGTNSSISLLQLDTEVTTELLCDAGNSNHSFIRITERSYDNGLPVGAPAVSDYETDFVTPYILVGVAVVCPTPDYETSDQILCDATSTQFLRRYALVDGVQVTVGDFALDGVTPYSPTLPVGLCKDVVTDPTPGGQRLIGATTLTLPTGTYRSFSVSVTAGPLESASLTTVNAPSISGGNFVADYIMPRGYSASWDIDNDQERLNGAITISVPAGSIVIVSTTE